MKLPGVKSLSVPLSLDVTKALKRAPKEAYLDRSGSGKIRVDIQLLLRDSLEHLLDTRQRYGSSMSADADPLTLTNTLNTPPLNGHTPRTDGRTERRPKNKQTDRQRNEQIRTTATPTAAGFRRT